MSRPTFIIAEPEPVQALSTRKLVIETAKFNVITAHSKTELLDVVERFPAADAIVIHTDLVADGRLHPLVDEMKRTASGKPVIVLTGSAGENHAIGDHVVDSHEPQELLELLRRLFGDPRPCRTAIAANRHGD